MKVQELLNILNLCDLDSEVKISYEYDGIDMIEEEISSVVPDIHEETILIKGEI